MSLFNKLSVLRKLFFSCLPLVLGVGLATFMVMKLSVVKSDQMAKALKMVEHISAAELAMVKMSEAMRGYLLNTQNENEIKVKDDADEQYVFHSEQVAALASESPAIAALNQKMMDYDEKVLHHTEMEIMELAKKDSVMALKFYAEKYVPARKVQNENFIQLKELVLNHSSATIAGLEKEKAKNGTITAITLLCAVLISLSFMFLINRHVVSNIRSIGQHLKNYSSQLDKASVNLTSTSGVLSNASLEQAAALEQTVASLEEITAMISKTTDNAKLTAKNATDSQEKAEQGKNVVEEMLNSMSEINGSNQEIINQMNQSNEQFLEIVKVIEAIGNKTKVINDIVFQTKLLSFNASVEAARAGEHGKGFSVVAEEVGNLAQMSGNASKEISDMLASSISKVDAIVHDSKSRVEKLAQLGKSKVDSGVVVAQRCATVLTEISNNIDTVSHLTQEISVATTEQSTGVSEINKAMNKLDVVTQQNSSISEESSVAANALAEQVKLLNEASSQLLTTINGEAA